MLEIKVMIEKNSACSFYTQLKYVFISNSEYSNK
jgi:hypothetical protein